MKRDDSRMLSGSVGVLAAMLACRLAMGGTAEAVTAGKAPELAAGAELQAEEESEWEIGGELRARFEWKDDAGTAANRDFVRGLAVDNDFLLFREKLHIGWRPEPWLQLFVEGRGSQAASDGRADDPERDVADLQQAWVSLGDPKRFPLVLKAGRQELRYGDQRFIGTGNWGNNGRVFDAVTLSWHLSAESRIDLFTGHVVIPRDAYFNEPNDEDLFSGIYASTREWWDGVETQAFFLARNTGSGSPDAIAPGIGGPSARDVYTAGVRVKSLPDAFDGWDFAFEGAGQFGEISSGGERRDLRAFALTGSAGYTFEDFAGTPRIGVGYDYASGDSDPSDGRHETFEPLFGTNHGFYGTMDLIGQRNLSSPRVSMSIRPAQNLSLSVDWLFFWLADTADSFYPESGSARNANGYGRNSSYGSFVGSEVDVIGTYSFTKQAELQVGYGHFFPGDYIRQSVNSVPGNGGETGADWVYVQAVFSF